MICSYPEILDAEARLEDAYRDARAARGDSAKAEQRDWVKRFASSCGLPERGAPSYDVIKNAQNCVWAAIETRIHELRASQ